MKASLWLVWLRITQPSVFAKIHKKIVLIDRSIRELSRDIGKFIIYLYIYTHCFFFLNINVGIAAVPDGERGLLTKR